MKKVSAVVGILFIASCAPMKITSTWTNTTAVGRTYENIVVVALTKFESEGNLRERMEEHIVGDLSRLGLKAVSSYKLMGPTSFKGMNEIQVLRLFDTAGIDGVLTVVLLDKKREQYYIPARVMYSPYAVYQNNFWGYYGTMYNRIYEPGYYSIDTRYFWESNLYDLKSKTLQYSIQTQAFDPLSLEALSHNYGKKIVESMVKDGVIKLLKN
ncbi:MAG: hypothetical protein K2P88_09465 [Chitinophagaceae bacterium]|nr:hypothetical protein [Chitinophagaceae bacterium]